MAIYLYRFGFESPNQFRNNAAHGWDDEDSQGVLIEAADEASALAWGREISERFIQLLFQDETISWQQLSYAHWLEPAIQAGDDNQPVAVGEFPDFATWLEPYSGRRR